MAKLHAIMSQVWIETRLRFAVAMSALCGLVTFTVLRAPVTLQVLGGSRPGVAFTFPQVMWFQLFHAYSELFWTLSVVALTMGGLGRDAQNGATLFTLSLPLSRRDLLLGRIFATILMTTTLAFIPYLTIPVLAPVAQSTFPISQALLFGLCLALGGMFIYGVTFLLACTIKSEIGSLSIALGAFLALYFLGKVPGLKSFDVFDIMSAKAAVSGETFLMTGTLPWTRLFACAASGVLTVLIAIRWTERKDF
jgi:ABC-type transport system involved in multi-copper enzyme maturation permease subunit